MNARARVKEEIERAKKQIDEIEEEARKAGVPPAGCADASPRARTRSDPHRRRQGLAADDAASRAGASGPRRHRGARSARSGPAPPAGTAAVVLSDLRLPDGDGFGVLRASKEIDPDVPVIVMTAYGSIEDAVAAMKEGAIDFLAKPVDPDHLLLLVDRALEQRRIVTENLLMKEELAVRRGAPQLVGEDPSLRKVFAALQRAATTDTTVLIDGESGTGKELVARLAARAVDAPDGRSSRSTAPRSPRPCSRPSCSATRRGRSPAPPPRSPACSRRRRRHAVPRRDRRDADSAAGQAPARARGERAFDRVGGTAPIQIDVRIVAATNRDLARRSTARPLPRGSLLPAVRSSRSRCRRCASGRATSRCWRELRRAVLPRDEEAAAARQRRRPLEQLLTYHWPGNVRELQNCIERAVILARRGRHRAATPEPHVCGAGRSKSCPAQPVGQPPSHRPPPDVTRRIVAEVEEESSSRARKDDNNKGRAAELLEITYKMLLTKLKEHRID